jgi:glycolate oxidase FAD binding subunit
MANATGPLWLHGGNTRGVIGQGDMVSSAGLQGISIYEPGALTLVAGAGTPLADIEATLAAEGQRLPFEPMDHRRLLGQTGSPTLGGVMAGNISGPRRVQAGAARDYALGVRFVDGAGRIIKNGGRVMKNVTGYDLVKLMCGSFGTLGMLTEVALKVLPVPETQITIVMHGLMPAQSVRAMAAAMGSPFEVSGAAYLGGAAYLRLEGFEASVAYRASRLQKLMQAHCSQIELNDRADIWATIRDVTCFEDRAGDVWRVSCRPSMAPELAARSGAQDAVFDWGGGLIWLLCEPGTDLRANLGAFDGHATRIRGTSGGAPRFQPEPAGVARISAAIRARFDPRGILNPGLMGAVG